MSKIDNKSQILNSEDVDRKLLRLSWEVYENNTKEKEIFIVGIEKRGYIIAKEIAKYLSNISDIQVNLNSLKINKDKPYHDEIKLDSFENKFINKVVILVDDVLNSGKTLMYSSKFFLNTKLKKLSILVLIDRNHNLFPIKADYVGLSLSTTLQEYIDVNLTPNQKGVYLS
tara:strand:- start:1194 stop:1706 length:513 start_codon:yes stop_codon:yes gene_type:complete